MIEYEVKNRIALSDRRQERALEAALLLSRRRAVVPRSQGSQRTEREVNVICTGSECRKTSFAPVRNVDLSCDAGRNEGCCPCCWRRPSVSCSLTGSSSHRYT